MVLFRNLHSSRFLFSSSCVQLRLRKALTCSKHRCFHDGNLQKPYYITTPIFYPNASPHIGHLYSLVTGDVFARYQRLKGRDVRFLAGTDEHGLKIQKAARVHFGEPGREREFCDTLSERFRDLARRANVSNTCFMRTSSKEHHLAVEDVWKNLYAKGYIYKSQYSGWYSITDECFYTDAQVADGHSLETGSAVEWSSEENYMFRLSTFRDSLLEHYMAHPDAVYPPQYHENVLAMLGAAPVDPTPRGTESAEDAAPALKTAVIEDFVLADISISRPRSRLEWGVQVPDDPEQTVYVWFDALLIYLTGAGYPWASPALRLTSSTSTSALHSTLLPKSPSASPADPHSAIPPSQASSSTLTSISTPPTAPISTPETPGWDQGWPADIQVIGKDILRFHAIYLPAILLALSSSGAGAGSGAATTRPQPHLQHQLGPRVPPQLQSQSQAQPHQTQVQAEMQAHRPIPLAKTLLTHAHWTSAQKKMSKSLGNVADPLEAMERWGGDVVRFYLMRVGGRWRGDVDWSAEQLDKHHKEIQAQLGNYFLRIASPRIAERARAVPPSTVPAGDGAAGSAVPAHFKALFERPSSPLPPTSGPEAETEMKTDTDATNLGRNVDPNAELLRLTLALPARFEAAMDQLEAGQALADVMSVLKVANKTLTDIAPWSKSTEPALVQTTRVVALETLRVAGVCLAPFMPSVSQKLLDGLRLSDKDRVVGIFGEKGGRDQEKNVAEEVERVWKRWVGRDVEGVKLF
ncbi:hypothetical protein GALMADRAFT_230009 [Galerina marginata CBS 339.88]|uniref:methionine--tRNA ligase n=1 Tax=Galerina marginata (strain CBS 339.88) TaxID=685588 RepID=A0A067SII0_GALM3|nr:hypothetical protein GALMADRAFT_230009 [Galerina marginata CBS 339.88]